MRIPRSTLLFLALPFILSRSSLAAPSHHVPSKADVRAVVNQFMEPYLAANHAPGGIVGVSIHGVRYYYSYGTATDAGARFARNTIVEIGSCTKVFTTTLFAKAVNSGKMQPDDNAQPYMPPGYSLVSYLTPLELADFSSGMPKEPPNLPVNHDIQHYTPTDFLTWASNTFFEGPADPAHPTAANYLYSNASVGLLTYLVVQAQKHPWQDLIRGSITYPLGMVDTEVTPDARQMRRMAEGHLSSNGMKAPPWPIFAWYGAGALRSTPEDMLNFGEANLGHRWVSGRPVPRRLTAAMKLAQRPIYVFNETTKAEGAMAWAINVGNQTTDMPEIVKNGGTNGFSSAILMNPSKDLTIFIVVNLGSDDSVTPNPDDPAPIAVAIGRNIVLQKR